MGKAARAIIVEGDKLLLMHRDKGGTKYFTLVGGKLKNDETIEQGLLREVKEETGLNIIAGNQVFFEEHPEPYNEQYIYLCHVAPHNEVAIQDYSEESSTNKLGLDVHSLAWVPISSFANVPFRTPQLQDAIVKGLKEGFPNEPTRL